jgi:hypothetical protein
MTTTPPKPMPVRLREFADNETAGGTITKNMLYGAAARIEELELKLEAVNKSLLYAKLK